jgi:hypothetical protein
VPSLLGLGGSGPYKQQQHATININIQHTT